MRFRYVESSGISTLWNALRLLKLDHLTVIAPTLAEGVSHVQHCLDLDVPFGTRHDYMGTHNHRLQLGNSLLEIVPIRRVDTWQVPTGTVTRRLNDAYRALTPR